MTEYAYRWSHLSDLTDEDRGAASDELPALVATWQEERVRLDPGQVARFHERLQREWAIETGIIEQIYTLDRGTTELLIEQGIDASLIPHSDSGQSPEFIAEIIRDQQSAVDWLFDLVNQGRPLSTSFVKELHALMTGRQQHAEGRDQFGNPTSVPLLHGQYKQQPNNPTRRDGSIHEYSPWEHVPAEMDRLVTLHLQHDAEGVPPEVESAWLHHRFTQIHPFQDGNGRVARALASLILIRANWFPVVITRDDRVKYIDALEAADKGTLIPLVSLFVRIEKRSFVKALSIVGQVQAEAQRIDQIVDAIGDMFKRRDASTREQLDQAKRTAEMLRIVASRRMDGVRDELMQRLTLGPMERRVFRDEGLDVDDERRVWNRYQVVGVARELDYFANLREYHEWLRLRFITENGRAEILLSFHGIGGEYRGLIGASMCFYRRQEGEDIRHQVMELQAVSDDLFQVNYQEDTEAATRRFRPWLDENLVRALDQWRRGE